MGRGGTVAFMLVLSRSVVVLARVSEDGALAREARTPDGCHGCLRRWRVERVGLDLPIEPTNPSRLPILSAKSSTSDDTSWQKLARLDAARQRHEKPIALLPLFFVLRCPGAPGSNQDAGTRNKHMSDAVCLRLKHREKSILIG